MANENIEIEVTIVTYYPDHQETQATQEYLAHFNYSLGEKGIILGAICIGAEYLTHHYSPGWNGLGIGLMSAGLLRVLTAASSEQRKRASTIDL